MADIETKSNPYTATHTINSPDLASSQDEDRDVDRFGYKAELERRFGLWSAMGLSTTVMISWEGWLTVCNVSLLNGGLAGSVYSFLFVWIGYTAVVASMAELVSMIPTAGGQYHWTYELAPAKYRKFISWITGWQIFLAWQAASASVAYLTGTIIQGLVILNWPDYVFERWHGTLIIWALVLLYVSINTVLIKVLPIFEGVVLILHGLLFFVVLIPLVHLAPHASAKEVFTQFQELGGYSDGTGWFVGLLSGVFAILGCDAIIHLSEEVRNSRVNVPRALMASMTINGVLGFAMVLCVVFTIGDLSLALEPSTGFVFINYFATALGSDIFATVLVSLLLVMFISACVAVMASTSRVTWAFARDNALPGSRWLKKVSTDSKVPLNAILLSGFITFLLSFINIGSAVAFNALVSLTVAAFFGTYCIPIAVLVWRRLSKQQLELGPWNLGSFGLLINIIAIAWLAITWTFSFFPVAIPVTLETMNWSCVIWGSIMLLGVVWYYVYQRHRFTGPAVVVGSMNIE